MLKPREDVFVCEKPDHPFTDKLREIAHEFRKLIHRRQSEMTVFGSGY
jgi:hypothetical protein